ncbi:MAG: conjugal transfer protein TraN [Oligoflexia bacterium]|nr:conjugal transfer protein TraN [Oligoflexia bacterium]
MRAKTITLTFLFCIEVALAYDIDEKWKKEGDALNSKYGSTGATTDLNTVPGYKGTDVPETQYYDKGEGYVNAAIEDAKKNETASYINTASAQRPKIKIDPKKDPLFKRVDAIEEKAHSLSESYQGCQKLPVGSDDITKYEKKSCFEYGRREQIAFSCDRQLLVSCRNSNAGETLPFNSNDFTITGPAFAMKERGTNIYFGSETNDRRGGCSNYTNTITFDVKSVDDIVEFRIESFMYDDRITLSLNGKTIFEEPPGGCERGQIFTKPGLDLKPYLKAGINSLTVVNLVAGTGRAWINLRASRKSRCDAVESYLYACENGKNYQEAVLASSNCIEGAETRNIKGTLFTKECWRFNDNFTQWEAPVYTKDPLCDELVQKGCGVLSNHCIESDPSYCKKREITYSCPYQESARFVDLCGDQLVCPDGKCTKEYQEYQPATEDFKKAATALEVAKMLSKELEPEKLSVFKGAYKECKESNLGFKNCCKDKGWGLALGITECNSDEKELGLAKESGRNHYIGSYKTGTAIDRRTYQSHCVYPSKLAKIIVEQGKQQLKKGFGETRSPDCSGLTLSELENLNFDQINFSEFYSDIQSKIDSYQEPDSNQAVAKFKETIEKKLKSLSKDKS